MKNFKILLVVFGIAFVFFACKKDDNKTPEKSVLEENYFGVENGSFIGETFPSASTSATAPVIDQLYGNSSVIAGGSNPISIQTSSSISNIYVGVSGESGYYKVPASSLKSAAETYLFILTISQDLSDTNFDIVIAIVSSNGEVSQHYTISVSKIEAGTGKLQVSCSWDKLNDVDLHLVEPGGEEIFYGNSYSANGGELDVDSNPGCSIDGINNENITYFEDGVVENGEYIVRLDLFSNCSIVEATNYVVTAYYNGEVINSSIGSNPYVGSFNPDDEDSGGAGSGVTVMKFNIGSSKKSSKEEKVSMIKFNYPAELSVKPKNLSPNK